MADAAQQPFIATAHYVVVVVCDGDSTKKRFVDRGKMYCHQQSGAAIQNFLLSLEEFGLATTWIGHFFDSHVKKILDIPKNVDVEAFFPIGYEKKTTRTRRSKTDLNVVMRFENYKNKKMQKVNSINV